jgi:hypothetical protein
LQHIRGRKKTPQVILYTPNFNIIAPIKGKTTLKNLATIETSTPITNKKPENSEEDKSSTENTRNSDNRTANQLFQRSNHSRRR